MSDDSSLIHLKRAENASRLKNELLSSLAFFRKGRDLLDRKDSSEISSLSDEVPEMAEMEGWLAESEKLCGLSDLADYTLIYSTILLDRR